MSGKFMKLFLSTPQKKYAELEVNDVSIPTLRNGQIQILPGHADLLSQVGEGVLAFHSSKGENGFYHLVKGVFEVQGGTVTVLADRAEEVQLQ